MAGQYGVQNVIEIMDLGFGIAFAGKQSLADGKVNFNDAQYIFPVIPLLDPAVKDAAVSLKEIAEIDDEDEKKVLDFVKVKVPTIVDDAHARVVAVAVFRAGLAVAHAISLL
jgi:hypothetical protein